MQKDLIIVGAGIFGLTIAQRAACELGKSVLVIDKRNHIGGNAFSEFDDQTGIEVHKYGAHLFHTSNERVWEYVNRFTDFTNYVHRVYTTHRRNWVNPETKEIEPQSEVFPMPINLGTINQFFHSAFTPNEARTLIAKQAADNLAAKEKREPANLAEQGVSLIGKPLFDAFIKNYTAKQWQTPAEELSASIIKRLPVRYNYDNRYFNNKYEGLPVDGYEKWFQNMIDSASSSIGSIEVKLNVDFFDVREELIKKNPNATLIYTGAIDRYYDYCEGELKWRSLDLKKEIVGVDDFQGCPVMNYADLEEPFTRIHEFKHFHPERKETSDESASKKWKGYQEGFGKTVIVKEYSKTWTQGEEPYYPVNTEEDRAALEKYQEKAKHDSVIFGGRLGEYKYYDMDQVFLSALEKFDDLKSKGVL